MNPLIILSIVDATLKIIANHQGPIPLTREQIHALLMADLRDGQSAIAQEFITKGWELPA